MKINEGNGIKLAPRSSGIEIRESPKLGDPVRFGRELGKVYRISRSKKRRRLLYAVELKGGGIVVCPSDSLRPA